MTSAVVEALPDPALGTSCRNSGVIHSGINYAPGTLRARLAVRGNAMMDRLCAELKVPIARIGKLTTALTEEDLPGLERLREQGEANGVPGMEVIGPEEIQRIQPGAAGIRALWTPSSGIISPYGLAIALAENARENGADFFMSSRVVAARREADAFAITCERTSRTGRETYELRCRVLINAAGLWSDEVSRMIGVDDGVIWACRGEYHVLDRRLAGELRTLVYPVPGPNDPGLGIHLTPTVEGSILVGPSAEYIPDEPREDYRTTRSVMDALRREGSRLLPGLRTSDFIRSFSGNRPKQTPPEVGGNADFTIERTSVDGSIRLQGIESPGLTSSPAIALMVRDLVGEMIELRERDDFVAERSGYAGLFRDLPHDEQMEMIAREPDYGEVICRCEHITKAEIRRAIEAPLSSRSLAAIKYRSHAMMGRCQGGSCIPRIVRILRDEYGMSESDIVMRSSASYMFGGAER